MATFLEIEGGFEVVINNVKFGFIDTRNPVIVFIAYPFHLGSVLSLRQANLREIATKIDHLEWLASNTLNTVV